MGSSVEGVVAAWVEGSLVEGTLGRVDEDASEEVVGAGHLSLCQGWCIRASGHRNVLRWRKATAERS